MQAYQWIILALELLLCRVIGQSQRGNCSSIAIIKMLPKSTYPQSPKILTLRSANECAALCCQKITDCNIAEFNFLSVLNNCIHSYCHPPEMCLEAIQNGSNDSVTFMMETTKDVIEFPKDILSNKHIIARTIKPRKGVELHPSNEVPHSSPEENSTTTPQVVTLNAPLEKSTVQLDIKTHGHIWENSSISSEAINHEFTAYTTEITTLDFSIPHLDGDNEKHTLPRKGAPDAERGSTTMPISKSQPYYKSTTLSSSVEELQSSTNILPINQTNLDGSISQKRNSTAAINISFSITKEITFPKSSINRSDIVTEKAAAKQPSNYIKSNNSKNGMPLVVTVSALINKSQNDTSIAKIPTMPKSVNATTTSSSIIPDKVYLVMNKEELYLQQSIYLIVSLIIGFLILLSVIGLILKHLHGVWERRHYQRMDFLIDGMYNTV